MIFSTVALIGLISSPLLTSCKREPSRELSEVREHLQQLDGEEEALLKKLQDHFQGTPYKFDTIGVPKNGGTEEGPTSAQEFIAEEYMPGFTLGILISGAGATASEHDDIKEEMRICLGDEQYDKITICYLETPADQAQDEQTTTEAIK